MRHLDVVLHMNICLCNSFGAHKPNKVLRPLCYMNCLLFCCWRLCKIAHPNMLYNAICFECFSMFHIAIKMIWFDFDSGQSYSNFKFKFFILSTAILTWFQNVIERFWLENTTARVANHGESFAFALCMTARYPLYCCRTHWYRSLFLYTLLR